MSAHGVIADLDERARMIFQADCRDLYAKRGAGRLQNPVQDG